MSRIDRKQKRYEALVGNTSRIVDELESITNSYTQFVNENESAVLKVIPELENHPFARARSRISSQLITVAVCGAFSSGKSFLVSGLLDRLKWYKRKSQDADFFESKGVDVYSPFLPSSPEQTSSCPLAVKPTSEENSRLEVLFSDTNVWENITEPYTGEDDIQRKMLAYLTDVEDWRNARPVKDLPREVKTANLYIPDMSLPAVIYDLPGIGGAEEEYLKIVHQSLREADCIVYVASAIKELTDVELDLLRFIYEIVEDTKSPVFFVLSQIDREPNWRKVFEKNNQFLETYFQKSAKPNRRFYGKGFIPVSPAVQAKANGLLNRQEITDGKHAEIVGKSGMLRLYETINNHLTDVSGPAYLKDIILQLNGLAQSLKFHADSRLQVETTPLEDANQMIQEYRELSKKLVEKRKALLDDLEELGKSALLAGFSTSDSDDLANLLKSNLKTEIQESDVLKDSVRHSIEQAKREIRDEWLRRPNGLEDTWTQAWNDYQTQTILLLQSRLVEAERELSLTPNSNILDSLRDKRSPGDEIQEKISLDGTVSLVNTAWQTWLSVTGIGVGGAASAVASAGGIGSLTTVATLTTALAPMGVFFITAGTVGLGWSFWKNHKDRQELRKLLLAHLEAYSDHTISQTKVQAEQCIDAYKGEVIKFLNKLIATQDEQIKEIERRMQLGDLKQNQIRIGLLRNYSSQFSRLHRK